jgi:hypothetical protein
MLPLAIGELLLIRLVPSSTNTGYVYIKLIYHFRAKPVGRLGPPTTEVRKIPRIKRVACFVHSIISIQLWISNAEDLGKGIVATNKNKTKEYTILLVGKEARVYLPSTPC